jgi:hypothetical protein
MKGTVITLNQAVSFVNNQQSENKSMNNIFNTDFFTKGNTKVSYEEVSGAPAEIKPRRGRPAKGTTDRKELSDGTEIVLAEEVKELPAYQSNEPYLNTYADTSNLLKQSVAQIDQLQGELKGELDQIRMSKTLKKKYDYIAVLTSTASTLIGTKVTAIREMNKTITDAHNLDMKRAKELNQAAAAIDAGNDDKRIMDMYNAFISTPVGSYNGPFGAPSISDMSLVAGTNNIIRTDMGDVNSSYNNYISNINPTQNMMRLENNPDIETVVKYDPNTGNRCFDVINMKTGESIPNVNVPDQMFLENINVNLNTMRATDTNLDRSYSVVVMGGGAINQY